MEDQAESWFRRRTSHWLDWPLERLLRWKASQGARVSVVIPAHDEEATVGGVVEAIAGAFMPCGLVDELVVMDSDSTDRTAEWRLRTPRWESATSSRCWIRRIVSRFPCRVRS
jgi:glucosyl-3-phosphoglycerate synthase